MIWYCFLVVYIPFMYSANVSLSPSQLQDVITLLWHSDTNRAKIGQVELNYQNQTKPRSKVDRATEKLFTKVDTELLSRDTVQCLISLFKIYKPDTRKHDVSDRDRGNRIEKFVDEILKTNLMNILQTNLQLYGYQPALSLDTFRDVLMDLWFAGYSRKKHVIGSSGFEHVFIGEIKRRKVSGLHNWIRIYWLENNGELNYTGYILKRNYVSIIQFKWGKYWKPIGSMFIGTSPEFDFAIFTLCFLTKRGQNACKFLIDDCTTVRITTQHMMEREQMYIGTAYPSPGKVMYNCNVNVSLTNYTFVNSLYVKKERLSLSGMFYLFAGKVFKIIASFY